MVCDCTLPYHLFYSILCGCAGLGVVNMGAMVNMQATATIAKELLKSGNSPTAEAMVKQSLPAPSQPPAQVGYFLL